MKRIAIVFACLLLVLLAIPLAFFTLVDLNDFQNPMLNASRDGNTSEISRLLANGTDPNTSDGFGNTPLSIAAHFGRTDAVKLLLKNGAAINGIAGRMTPLQCAVYSEHPETAACLLTNGADPNAADKYGTTPLAIAANKGNAILARLLLDAGANVEQEDDRGWRPLHIVLRSTDPTEPNRFATVCTLLEYGADPNVNNAGGFEDDYKHDSHVGHRQTLPNKGNTPVSIARSNGFTEIVTELTKHGGT
ncbi:MAG: ankyrin repeat domain-containing protein [Planctomycetaceae bacterium]|nr:ankyrin repeat domain-containing protein [Planctomycetaceae bacterium]